MCCIWSRGVSFSEDTTWLPTASCISEILIDVWVMCWTTLRLNPGWSFMTNPACIHKERAEPTSLLPQVGKAQQASTGIGMFAQGRNIAQQLHERSSCLGQYLYTTTEAAGTAANIWCEERLVSLGEAFDSARLPGTGHWGAVPLLAPGAALGGELCWESTGTLQGVCVASALVIHQRMPSSAKGISGK